MNIRHALFALAFGLASAAAFAQDTSSTPATDSSTPAADTTAAATPAPAPAAAPAKAKAKAKSTKVASVKHKQQCKKGDTLVKGKCEPKKVS
jgi:hypothetical protein